jgi:predicted permease
MLMSFQKELWRRLRYLAKRSRFHSELSEEMQFHVECRAAELEEAGLTHGEAILRARREFGSRMRVAEDTHGIWQMRWLEELSSDLRYAARALRRNPAFALTAIFCLALGIGANTTIFSITTSFLFSQPSCRDASSLIAIWEGGNSSSSIADYQFLRNSHIFEGVAGINPEREVNWKHGEETSRLYAGLVTDDFFSMLGVPFYLGRGIAPGETDTAVLSYRLWRRRFGADPAVVGRKIVLDGRLHMVVGVLPADHRTIVGFGFSPEIYVSTVREDDFVQFYARLPEGMNRTAAGTRLKVLFRELDRIAPKDGLQRAGQVRITGVTGLDILAQQGIAPVVAFFGVLTIVVGLVLLIACTNVASLLLSRAASRSQELAIRLSLGASRMRIVRHLLAESLLLAALGATAGLVIDVVCARVISNLSLPLPIPIQLVVAPDWRLLVDCVLVAILSALIAGLMPALKAVRKDMNDALKSSQRQTERLWGLRSVLVTGQLAVSIVLLATGFLFIHNLLRATSMNPGFDTRHTIWAYMRLVPEKYKDRTKATVLVEEALDRLRALPGVEAAAITRRVPLNDNCVMGIEVSTDLAPTPRHVMYECIHAGPDYFRAIGIPLLRGREFSAQDRKGAQLVAIVNETFARTLFGNTDPIGHTITMFQTTALVVGLVKDSKYFTLGEKQRLAVYEPYFAHDEPVNLNFIVRTLGPPSGFVKPVTDVLGRLDSSAAIETKPMIQSLGLALLPSQAGAAMLGAMGILSMALAGIGLYGVILYSVARRTREIGLRVALGATPGRILLIVCRHSFALTGAGMFIGLGLAFFATRPLAMFLVPGLSASDPAAFLTVVVALTGVALLATLAPAVRALRVDPMTALRYE